MVWSEWLSVLALLVAIGALLVSTVALRVAQRTRRTRLRPRPVRGARAAVAVTAATGVGAFAQPMSPTSGAQVAFVCNPTKPGAVELRDAAIRACASRYMPEPMWFETTAADPGVGQARAAVERGAMTVVAVGGDGTVRAVAEALAGTDVAMGLIPLGTGNLLARNLDLPLTDTDELLRLALTGPPRAIDVGWLRVERYEDSVADDIAEAADDVPDASGGRVGASAPDGVGEPPRDHIFLVIAGLGFDAAVMGAADEDLKKRVGWFAYALAGIRHLNSSRMRLTIAVDGGEPTPVRVRSLLVGNCGRLPGGITLLPDARIDDGVLDLGAIDTRGGIAGWTQLVGEVALQGIGVRTELPGKMGKIEHSRARTLHVVADHPEQIQVDGDNIGEAFELTVRVDPRALRVRTATPA
ncbi:diacylglycerol kinase family protein [Cellulomonas sp. ATA003]|uniref:diacylglycerol/lipid kinase family protein n=1 Tax=Cellulomonas sp. ATA003 TaxID=3073064 RepID=UPI002872D49C|nr:diacylglycerol kinase family protein [Cellulomonas sp. ATA003]WNB85502.1 diacylglycerol kinase family protein [Cellulomonas sp. ATA003]